MQNIINNNNIKKLIPFFCHRLIEKIFLVKYL